MASPGTARRAGRAGVAMTMRLLLLFKATPLPMPMKTGMRAARAGAVAIVAQLVTIAVELRHGWRDIALPRALCVGAR